MIEQLGDSLVEASSKEEKIVSLSARRKQTAGKKEANPSQNLFFVSKPLKGEEKKDEYTL